jgi:hypothetical protein
MTAKRAEEREMEAVADTISKTGGKVAPEPERNIIATLVLTIDGDSRVVRQADLFALRKTRNTDELNDILTRWADGVAQAMVTLPVKKVF